MSETNAQASRRLACLNCGASGARAFLLDDERLVRACDDCLQRCDHVADWGKGKEIIRESICYAHYGPFGPDDEEMFYNVKLTEMCVSMYGKGDIHPVRVREPREGEASNYWGWWDNKDHQWEMVYPHRTLARMCFTYGPEIEEEQGKGHFMNVVVEAADGS